MQRIIWFKDLTIADVPKVGGKNASLGEMYRKLTKRGVNIPNGFAITADAYQEFLQANQLDVLIKEVLADLDTKNLANLQARGRKIRQAIVDAKLPEQLITELEEAYQQLSHQFKVANVDVAVRSSATAEDLPGASFAGEQETYLDIVGIEKLLTATKECFASLFTDRAISYREDKGFDHTKIYLSVGIQKMVRSDKACSGVMFSIDPDTGFPGVVVINSSWGLGEMIVQGAVIPDEFQIHKETLKKGFPSIIAKEMGTKLQTLIYGSEAKATKLIDTPKEKQQQFTLKDKEIIQLAKWAVQIEEHYGKPMDMEWAKDGVSEELFIVQARPETIHAGKSTTEITSYIMHKSTEMIVKGASVGAKIADGEAHVILSASQINQFKKGEVLVTKMTDPDWEPIMKIASAIVTDEGGRTSHAAIVSRELGIPAIVGSQFATEKIKNGLLITVDCSTGAEGYVWKGKCDWEVKTFSLNNLKKPKTKIMINIGSPDEAYEASFLPNDGVGLAREEFIIASHIKVHPNALINFDKLTDKKLKEQIDQLALGYPDKVDFYVQKLAQGVAQIAAAFYPKKIIVRFSDFKTNEYATLLGGEAYEPKEENPMIGWRGSSRYYDPNFEHAFGLECKAIKIAREEWGLKNIAVMVPFCRTPEEGRKVAQKMVEYGLKKGVDDLLVYMMAEIPSNIIEAEEFIKIFDGFSIGSNDLTQLTLGIDRDNAHLAHIANEKEESVKAMIKQVIKVAKKHHKYVGICGQAPSDYPDFAQFLVELGIESISLNPDSIIKTTMAILETEKKVHRGVRKWLK
ncbi:phosphoenolpyruvate synthase [Patescibacteria group bacterium]|nr:phosphoenolpyruvate synthase [Patescibacteria group bacterium]